MSFIDEDKYHGKFKCPYCKKSIRWTLFKTIYTFGLRFTKWKEDKQSSDCEGDNDGN